MGPGGGPPKPDGGAPKGEGLADDTAWDGGGAWGDCAVGASLDGP